MTSCSRIAESHITQICSESVPIEGSMEGSVEAPRKFPGRFSDAYWKVPRRFWSADSVLQRCLCSNQKELLICDSCQAWTRYNKGDIHQRKYGIIWWEIDRRKYLNSFEFFNFRTIFCLYRYFSTLMVSDCYFLLQYYSIVENYTSCRIYSFTCFITVEV